MKKLQITLLVALVALCLSVPAGTLSAQTLPTKYPLLELFTNTPCAVCGSQNPGFFNRLDDYEGQYHQVSFYPGTPYSSCIFYQANISENSARKAFYPQIVGSPDVGINGTDFRSPSGVTASLLDDLVDGTSWLSVEVSESSGTSRTVTISMTDHAGGSLDTGVLYAVIVEKEVMYNAPNGENIHHNVFRAFLTDVDGEIISLSSGAAVKAYQYDVDEDWEADQVYVVAWLTGQESKEVINSGTKFDEVTTSARDISARVSLEVYPNPATEYVTVVLPEQTSFTMIVFDTNGQIVRHENQITTPRHSVDVSSLPPGIYIMEVVSARTTARSRFEVVR